MTRPSPDDESPKKKVRVPFRRNRSPRRRERNWTQSGATADERHVDAVQGESIVPKGALSRQRTIMVGEQAVDESLRRGTVVAARGLYADVDDGERIVPCTIRRILRTRLIAQRSSVTVGDRVRFSLESTGESGAQEGAIEHVEPRTGQLCRKVGKRVQTIVANVDQAVIVASAARPDPKPNLIDRYIVTALAGGITPLICMNKMDLDVQGSAREILDRYQGLGYATLSTSAESGEGVGLLRSTLRDKASVIAGQSGVGKSSLLNAVQPGLALRTGDVIAKYDKGRHTTTTAVLHRLDFGGFVVDTPGIRSLDVSVVPRGEFEALFVEFLPFIPNCKFTDCTHTHEGGCAIKQALEQGHIHPDRYDSYVRLFTEPL